MVRNLAQLNSQTHQELNNISAVFVLGRLTSSGCMHDINSLAIGLFWSAFRRFSESSRGGASVVSKRKAKKSG